MALPELERPFVIAFDMDGLIYNSEDLYDDAFGRLLAPIGKKFTREIKLKMMGKRAPDVVEVLRSETGIEGTFDEIHDEMESHFLEIVHQSLKPMPGFMKLLDQLEEKGIRRAVATSCRRELAIIMLEKYDLVERMEFVLCGDEVANGKPAPDIYLEAAKRFEVDPNQVVVFEDSYAGNVAASTAGAYAIAVPNVHTLECDFSSSKWVADTLEDPRIEELLFSPESLNKSQA